MWVGLCNVIGLSDLPQDARFIDGKGRLANKEALWAILEPAFLARSAAQWLEPLQKIGVPVGLIKTVPEALEDARHGQHNMIISMQDQEGHAIEVVGNPIKLVGETPIEPLYPPQLGEHADEVLQLWLGVTQAA